MTRIADSDGFVIFSEIVTAFGYLLKIVNILTFHMISLSVQVIVFMLCIINLKFATATGLEPRTT